MASLFSAACHHAFPRVARLCVCVCILAYVLDAYRYKLVNGVVNFKKKKNKKKKRLCKSFFCIVRLLCVTMSIKV